MDYKEFCKMRGIPYKEESDDPDNTERNSNPEKDANSENFATLELAELRKFAGKRKLCDKSTMKNLDKENLQKAILEKIKAKVVESGKTAEEVSAIADDDLIKLFDSIG